ncbi:MAG: hypothetical protein HQL67_10165 [Magnetococcales bacterium]|nr:hypothetical protein [Magnetococcales bacterium]
MSQPLLVLVHGWGLGPGAFRPLLGQLGRPFHHSLDLGFYGRPRLDIPKDRPLIAIGHSLGFMWLLQHLPTALWADQIQGLVAINSSTRFCRGFGFASGVHPNLVRRMKSGLLQDPSRVINDFRVSSGGPSGDFLTQTAKDNLDVAALDRGLDWLMEWDGRRTFSQWERPFLALANRDDTIVTPAMTEASFASDQARNLHWIEGGGHLAMLTRPEPFGVLLNEWLRDWA